MNCPELVPVAVPPRPSPPGPTALHLPGLRRGWLMRQAGALFLVCLSILTGGPALPEAQAQRIVRTPPLIPIEPRQRSLCWWMPFRRLNSRFGRIGSSDWRSRRVRPTNCSSQGNPVASWSSPICWLRPVPSSSTSVPTPIPRGNRGCLGSPFTQTTGSTGSSTSTTRGPTGRSAGRSSPCPALSATLQTPPGASRFRAGAVRPGRP